MRKTMVGMAMAWLALAPAVHATEITSLDGQQLVKLVVDAGYRAELDSDGEGDPMVRSAASGASHQIYMYGCDQDKRCTSIQFSAGFDLVDGTTLEKLNEWNRVKRYGNAWLDEDRDPWLELDLSLEGGATEAQLREYVLLWDTLVGDFRAHIGY